MQPDTTLDPSARNIVIVCAAAAGGLIIGGFSVLAIALAVIEPPSHDAPAGSAVFDGPAHAVQQVPATLFATPQAAAAPASSAASSAVASIGAASQPTLQQTPAQVLDKAWPDTPRARAPRGSQTVAAVTPPNATSNGRSQTKTTQEDSDKANQVASNIGPSPYDSWNNFFGYSRSDTWRN